MLSDELIVCIISAAYDHIEPRIFSFLVQEEDLMRGGGPFVSYPLHVWAC